MDIDSSSGGDEEADGPDLPDEGAAEEDDETSGDENMPEHITQLADPGNEDEELLLTGLDLDRPSRLRKGKRPQQLQPRNRHPTLDDDFFSIVNFNKEIEAAEAQSKSRGHLDESSDEESIDLFEAVPEDDEPADQDGHADGGCMCYCPSYYIGHVYSSFVAHMYGDFFAPLPKTRRDKGKGRADSSVPSRNSKVRFHEEVRVKMVKSHGNMTSLHETESDSDNEDTEGLSMFDQDEQKVVDSPEEDDGEEEEGGEERDEDEDSEEQDEDAFETMERFKDDLFTDEELKETSESFRYTYRNTD
jgi:U3 small nucleolar RNA-associated protein MPP10